VSNPLSTPRILAHRGNSSAAPENTLASFDAALTAGADAIEVDLRRTADGTVVVIHDDSLERTTNASGTVSRTGLETLRAADAGSWFSAKYTGAQVPTLPELAAWAVAHPGVSWLFEFKGQWSTVQAAAALDVLRAHNLANRSTVQGFSVDTVRALGMTGPEFRQELLIKTFDSIPGLLGLLHGLDASGCNPYGELLLRHPQLTDQLHGAGYSVTPWTLDEPEQWAVAMAQGVDGIITNKPAELRSVLGAPVPA
jgi:glycerophosphoryl diester phosphodiesterase